MKKNSVIFGLLCILFTVSCATENEPKIRKIELEEEMLMSSTAGTEDDFIEKAINMKGDALMQNKVDVVDSEIMTDLFRLIEGNKKCVFELFVFGFLPSDGYVEGSSPLLQVHSDEFPAFADLAQYVKSIYCEQEATRLLYGHNGNALYLDVDGILHTDIMLHGGMGYYVSWDDYEIIIRDLQEDTCDFDLVTTEEFDDKITEVILSFQVLLENHVWKLKEMVY
jgi:hypothetical protein